MANYFVTENWLKKNTAITDNVDITDVTPIVQFSAKAFVKPLLGTYFFDDLLDKYNNQTLSSDEEILVEKMQFAIGWRTCAQATIQLTYQLKNKGLQTQFDDNSTAVEQPIVDFMYNHCIAHTKLFEKEMSDYLIENKDLYPNFTSDLNKDSSLKKSCCNGNPDDSYNEPTGLFFL